MNKKTSSNYQQQKNDFLDNLQPNDFRNGESFNQAGLIIDKINQGLLKARLNQEDLAEFISKAIGHLFRQDSPAILKATQLFNAYLEEI